MEGLKKKVLKFIDDNVNQLVDLTCELIKFPSEEGNESEIQDYVAGILKKLDLKVDKWELKKEELKKHEWFVPVEKDYHGRPNVVGVLKGGGGGKSIILNGHVDVVPVENPSKWKHDPWRGTVENGRIYGRGALDMKGGVAAMIMAVKSIVESQVRLKGDVIIESVIDEEAGGNGTLACAIRGYTADGAIIPEPSSTSFIAAANRGAQFFRITVPGEEAPIEEQHKRINAINKAAVLYNAVENFALMREVEAKKTPYCSLYKLYHQFYGTIVPTAVCKISAGVWPSSLPGECVLEGSLECLPGEDIREVRDNFKSYLVEVSKSDPWLKEHPPNIEWFGLVIESAVSPPDHPLAKLLQYNAEIVSGSKPVIVGGGGSDLRCLTNYANTPAFLFGPGGGGMHGDDEFVLIDELVKVAKIIAATIIDWCNADWG